MIFNVCDCTWGCADTIRDSERQLWEKKNFPCYTRELNLPQRHASKMLHQLSYVPTSLTRLLETDVTSYRCTVDELVEWCIQNKRTQYFHWK